jgi:hypothetical protein
VALGTVLDLLGLVLYIVVVIATAAGVTWTVVRFSPTSDKPAQPR